MHNSANGNSARGLQLLYRFVPALDSLRTYSQQAFVADLMAGVTVATVAVPQAMAYASLAGMPPQYGLYTAIVMTAVGALLDSSRQLINGPTNAISIALLSALAFVPEGDKIAAAVLLAFLVGVTQLAIALMRLGDLTRYVSHSVVVGFTLGASILLILDQLKNLLGMKAGGGPEDHFLTRFWLSMRDGGGVHWPTLSIGLGTIAIVLAVRQFNNFRRARGARFPIPQHLVGVVAMAALVWCFDLHTRYGVKIVGPVPAALPRFQFPAIHWEQVRLLAGNAFALAMLGLLEAVSMAKSIATRSHQKLDINQQCLSEGAANLIGSLFQCIPGSGSLTRSAVNQQAGAVSQWSGVFSAIAVAAMMLLFAPAAQYIPRSALAGLLMLASFRMVDRKQLLFHLRSTRFDAGVVLATALAAIVISVEFCILIGVFLSFVLYVPRAAQVRLAPLYLADDQRIRERQKRDPKCPKLLCYELEGELFFGAEPEIARHFDTILEEATADTSVVLLVVRRARNPDAVFLSLMENFHRQLKERSISLLLTGIQDDLAIALTKTGLDNKIGLERLFGVTSHQNSSARDAVEHAYLLLGDSVCAICPRGPNVAKADLPLDFDI